MTVGITPGSLYLMFPLKKKHMPEFPPSCTAGESGCWWPQGLTATAMWWFKPWENLISSGRLPLSASNTSVTTPPAHSGPEWSQEVLDSPRSSLRFGTNPHRKRKNRPSILFISEYATPTPSLHASRLGRLYVIRIYWTPPKCQAARRSWHALAEAAVSRNRGLWFRNVSEGHFWPHDMKPAPSLQQHTQIIALCNLKRQMYRMIFSNVSNVFCISKNTTS